MSQVVAVDVGSGFVKTVTLSGEQRVDHSYVARRPASMSGEFSGQNLAGVVSYNGEVWMTGQAAESAFPRGLEDTQTDTWPGSDGWIVLLLRALYDTGIRRGEVSLVVGVPQKVWSPAMRDVLVDKLVGRHQARMDSLLEDNMDITVLAHDSMVLPQAYSGISWLVDNDDRASEMMGDGGIVAGIDPGTYTTGYVALENRRYLRELSGGVHDAGIWQVAQRLRNRLNDQYGWLPSANRALSIIRNPSKVFIAPDNRDLRPLLSEVIDEVTTPLIERLDTIWGKDAPAMDILVYGGGSHLFLPSIKRVFPHARKPSLPSGVLTLPQFIPAVGMLMFFIKRNDLAVVRK